MIRELAFSILLAVGTLCVSAPSVTFAQGTIRGTVRDSTTGATLSGAVVAALDASDRTIARTISELSGAFRLSVTSSPTRLRVIHIGYQPRDIVFHASNDTTIQILLVKSPPLLDVVRASGDELCPRTSRNDQSFQLWERARAGLLATIVSRESNAAFDTTLTYRRRIEPAGDIVHEQSVVRRKGTTTRPFTAASPPNRLATAVYLREDASGRTFYLPDADVLLDESFADTHCFHAVPGHASHSGDVGLAFRPVGHLDHSVDVEGEIWIDRAREVLQSVEFHYTGVDVGPAPTGRVDFVSVANGASFISDWSITIPTIQIRRAAVSTSQSGRTSSARPDEIEVTELYTAGGQTVSARWRDGTVWRAPGAAVIGKVSEHGTQRAVAHVVVTFEGTSDTLSTDSAGHFASNVMIPGRYTMHVTDTALAALGRDRSDTHVVEIVSGHVTVQDAELPSYNESIAQVCRGASSESNSGMLIGRVTLPAIMKIRAGDARIKANWTLESDRAVAGSKLGGFANQRDGNLDARGRFVICGLPLDRAIRLHLSASAASADTTLTIVRDSVKTIDWHPFAPR
jgi:hypothetical protein